MCGISGYVVLDGGATPNERALHRMNEMLVHRGPDEAGHHACAQVGFAMRRLSIIDVEDGHQPVFSLGGEVMVVFNGEIYNHLELRRDLEKKGHSFQSNSDSEILPAMYLQYGADMVEHLNGMFAIALWDFRRNRCFLWRDRFGQKPLYTTVWRGVFYFASEIKSGSWRVSITVSGFKKGYCHMCVGFLVENGRNFSVHRRGALSAWSCSLAPPRPRWLSAV